MGLGPENSLPLPSGFLHEDDYVEDLLNFVTSSHTFKTIIEDLHILDLFISTPDMYRTIFSEDWRSWFSLHDIDTLLDFILREDLQPLLDSSNHPTWRGQSGPPRSLVEYIIKIKSLSLNRAFHNAEGGSSSITRRLSVGMKAKKIHEVGSFADYIQNLTLRLKSEQQIEISRFVDFGAGQGYLGRSLASEPYNRNVIAVESKAHNIEGAKSKDVYAEVAPKIEVRRNKKQYRAQRKAEKEPSNQLSCKRSTFDGTRPENTSEVKPSTPASLEADLTLPGKGNVQHVQHQLQDGNLEQIVADATSMLHMRNIDHDNQHASGAFTEDNYTARLRGDATQKSRHLFVMSLHSCGNLTHHALRSITLNTSVVAVAAVGCCYNLLTERLRPPSYKREELRQSANIHGKNDQCGDREGFPMSEKLCKYPTGHNKGLSIGISARMMAVQAPTNWTRDEAHSFFTKHFFRALLLRVFLEKEIIEPPIKPEGGNPEGVINGCSPAGGGGSTQPIVIGSLSKNSYSTFPIYARHAIKKVKDAGHPKTHLFNELEAMTEDDFKEYASAYKHREKEVGIMWTMMALSASLIESVIVVDRWLWLREQDTIDRCWVETVFDYQKSPRNLVVIGIKKTGNIDRTNDKTF